MRCLFAVGFAAAITASAAADAPRGVEGRAPELQLVVKKRLKFAAGPILAPGTYIVTWTGDEALFVIASTMQDAARVATEQKPLPEPVAEPKIALSFDKGNKFTLTIKADERYCALAGEVIAGGGKDKDTLVDRLSETPSSLPALDPASQPTADPVEMVFRRGAEELEHCVDKATQLRWTPLETKYQKCVCPLVATLRFPKGEAERVFPLSKTASVHFKVDAKGRVQACELTPPLPKTNPTKTPKTSAEKSGSAQPR